MTRFEKCAFAAAALAAGAAAMAAETIAYTYDARGRLIQSTHNGSLTANVVIQYDKADNWTLKKTTGAP